MRNGFVFIVMLLCTRFICAQSISDDINLKISDWLNANARVGLSIGKISIDSSKVESTKKRVVLYANTNCSYIPFRDENVKYVYSAIRNLLPSEYDKFQISLITNDRCIEDLIPLSGKTKPFTNEVEAPLVTCISKPYIPSKGLLDRHIALWQSHGYYFEQKLSRWEWQRARIFQTVEDLYTQSYVLPYLIPMLENAGANVLIPRERDWQTHEVIVDNDGGKDNSLYIEQNAKEKWSTGDEVGFAHKKNQYIDNENPFKDGTYREVKTIKKGSESYAEWLPCIPAEGEYAVYVSYHSLPNSTEDALYTVYHKGGKTRFKVNQTMGGGTWIYLGRFSFDAGKNNDGKVVLSNISKKSGRIVTADAVKIGGGYGNIARKVNSRKEGMPEIDFQAETSGYPRFTEAARYWLQWAGFPDSVYTLSKNENDYTDDYKSRGEWVNYLRRHMNVPVDMAFAFHSDAGTTMNDSIIGTLGIFCTTNADAEYKSGVSRYVSRDLTDLIQTNIVNDIRRCYEPEWSRRGMWNQSYYEARVPEVPTMLLELLSHQNFADMRYGLDPRFRFTVCRAIYKGMLQFLCAQYGMEYVVQPLPVDHMSIRFIGSNQVELAWQPVRDTLEISATPEKYIVYTRIGEGDFDNGTLVNEPRLIVNQNTGVPYSYKVTAVNKGGESFPSEILSACRTNEDKGTVLVVNGFDRISAPDNFVSDGIAGFYDSKDHGVPDKQDISFIGSMCEFRRSIPWMDDDAAGFGASRGDYEKMVIAGNTFDYPYLHGNAITKAGYSYVSCSNEAVMSGKVNLSDYKIVDLILGKQKQVKIGRGVHAAEFKTFPESMQQAVKEYCTNGGNIFVSGAYVATDLWDNIDTLQQDRNFATDILKYKWRTGQAAVHGKVKSAVSPFSMLAGNYEYYDELNPESYIVESPDAIEPAGENSYTIFRYAENNLSAGVAYKGNYKTCVLGFPFEAIKTSVQREKLMNNILHFFENR